MILLVVGSLLLAGLWIARIEGSGSALVFNRFRCHGQMLATLFALMLVANSL